MTRWPGGWKAIENSLEAADFVEALRRLLAPGHPLFGLPLRAIGREWNGILALFAFDDGSGRVAVVHLLWKGEPMEPPLYPYSKIYDSQQEAWIKETEWYQELKKRQPDPAVVPRFKKGDRVMLLKHFDWAGDARATIVQEGRPRLIFDGSTHVEYMVEFDEPQPEINPPENPEIPTHWAGTTVLEQSLRPLSPAEVPGRVRRFRST